jgi:hypothetical protein
MYIIWVSEMANIKRLLISSIFFFFVYDVQLKGLPTLFSSRKLALAFLVLFSVIHYRKKRGVLLRIPVLNNGKGAVYKNYLISVFFVWCYSVLIALFHNRMGESYVDAKNLAFFLMYSVVAPFFLKNLFSDREALFKTLIFVGRIQSTIVYALFVSSGLRGLFDQLFRTDARFGYTSANVKVLGLGSGGAALSVLLFLSLYSIGYFLFMEVNVISNTLMYVYILGASLLTGRTGFFAGILLGMIILWKRILLHIKGKTVLKMFSAFFVVVIIAGGAFGLAMRNDVLRDKIMQTLGHLKISETISMRSDSSFIYFISKMNLPEPSLELIYGAGYGRGISLTGVNVQNDIGYVQRFFSLGLVFGTVFYLTNFICFWKMSLKIEELYFRFYYRVLIFILFILEFKESFFYYYLVPSIVLLIGLIDLCKQNEEKEHFFKNKCDGIKVVPSNYIFYEMNRNRYKNEGRV